MKERKLTGKSPNSDINCKHITHGKVDLGEFVATTIPLNFWCPSAIARTIQLLSAQIVPPYAFSTLPKMNIGK